MSCKGLIGVVVCMGIATGAVRADEARAASATHGPVDSVSIQLSATDASTPPAAPPQTFTARFTREDILPLLVENKDMLPMPMRFAQQHAESVSAMQRVATQSLVEAMVPYLKKHFPDRFNAAADLIVAPVPADKQVTLEASFLPTGQYTGPAELTIGFMLRDIDERTYVNVAIHVVQVARKLLDTGDPAVDQTAPQYYELVAGKELAALRSAYDAQRAQEQQKADVRQRVGRALDALDAAGNIDPGRAKWVKESRRFSYVVRDGAFIDKIRPLVENINREVELSGFAPDGAFITDRPGIHFDPDLRDVEILLPRPQLELFLAEADLLERRMAEDAMITIEVVRLTDRDILSNAVASQLNAQVQTVHDVGRYSSGSVMRQAGINVLTAIANRELQISNLSAIEAGSVPVGTSPIAIPPFELPPLNMERTFTNIGSTFSIGADEIFFDGREQRYGFNYVGPDGVAHTLSYDVVASLRDFWERIERNLIVHKIKKTEALENFTVPVGPESKTFPGIAALISQQNQEVVVATATGALSELSATAGTWLVIKDFEITPTPGSSTALTEQEIATLEHQVLLTMLLRDPLVEADVKAALVDLDDRQAIGRMLNQLRDEYRDRPLRGGHGHDTLGELFEKRLAAAIEDASVEKKELNSKITLTFYSSQGTILAQSGATALGDANDLTSFTTELDPNKVTPISSFFTKTADGTSDTSPLTGQARGERETEEKTMTHLVIRARFPTVARERSDRDEGRYLGYFDLPMGRDPLSAVNLPFLSSSEHPLDRLAQLRLGTMFAALDRSRIRDPFLVLNPNRLVGDVPRGVWEACTARVLFNMRIVSDSSATHQALAAEYRRRFVAEVRSLLEYDEDLFDAPSIALRNMTQWNDPLRIVLALNNSADRFALQRLIAMLDDLGKILVPRDFIDWYLATAPADLWGRHRLRPLSDDEVRDLRRDVAAHFLRLQEIYGDAFLEAISIMLNLGTYNSLDSDDVQAGLFRSYRDFVLFDTSSAAFADATRIEDAHEEFLLLRSGGVRGQWFEPSLEFIEQLDSVSRPFVVRGKEIIEHRQTPSLSAAN